MSHRVHIAEEQLKDHLNEREWTREDQEHFLHMIGRSALLNCQNALAVLEYQQATDERIEAEKEHDRWAIGRSFDIRPRVIPEEFFEERLPFPVIERPDIAQLDQSMFAPEHIQKRFEETI